MSYKPTTSVASFTAAIIASLIVALALTFAFSYANNSQARDSSLKTGVSTTIGVITVSELPKQGRDTLELIRRGGPYPYAKDGTVFGNRERILPKENRGHYKEFTVKTPGSRDRGARRIVCGGNLTSPAASICYYTADHYASFKRIKE